jgi:hypothetical protein
MADSNHHNTVYNTLTTAYLVIVIVVPIVLAIVFGVCLLWYLEKSRRMALCVVSDVPVESMVLDHISASSEATQCSQKYSRHDVTGPVNYWG